MANYKKPTHEDIEDRSELVLLNDTSILALLHYPTGDKLFDVQNEALFRVFTYILDMRTPIQTKDIT